MSVRPKLLVAAVLAGAVVASMAYLNSGTRGNAPTATPEMKEAVALRKSRYQEMGTALKALKDELSSGKPDMVAVRRSASQLRDTGKKLDHWFPPGSGPDAGLDTKASATIWKRPADFQRANLDYQAQAEAFTQAVAGGDLALVATKFRALGDACSGCHKPFRIDDD